MESKFEPAEVEPRWRLRWEQLEVGRADAASDRPSFTIALPPPNITAPLHMGHAMGGSIQDGVEPLLLTEEPRHEDVEGGEAAVADKTA